jgi:hypothetical protein
MTENKDVKEPTDKSAKAPDSKETKPVQDSVDKTKIVDPTDDDEGDDDEEVKGLPEKWQKKFEGLKKQVARRSEDLQVAKQEVKIAKEEAAALKKAKDDEELEKKKKNGEWEQVAQEKDKALQRANERTMRAELRLFAQQEGILDPSDVNNLSLEGLTLDESGEVHGAEKVIKKLKADKPHWFKSPEDKKVEPPKSTSSPIIEPPKGKAGKGELSDLSPAEYESRKKDFISGLKARR